MASVAFPIACTNVYLGSQTAVIAAPMDGFMLAPYIIYFTFVSPGDKKHGAVKQFRIYANNWEEARRLASEQSTYTDIDVLRIVPA